MLRKTKGDVVFDVVNHALLIVASLLVIYPLYYIVIASFSNPSEVLTGKVILWPKGFQLESYAKVFNDHDILTGYLNSILYTVSGTAVSMAFTMTAGYSLSRKDLVGRKPIMFLFTFTMFFSGGLIPTYMLVKSLGMVNKIWALIIPNAVSIWNLIIVRTFFESTIPTELLEASKMDGCSNFRFFVSVVLPLSNAIIAVMVLFYAVGQWNSYFQALVYIKDRSQYPLQLVLRNILIASQATTDLAGVKDRSKLFQMIEMMKYALVIVSSVPVLIMYPFVQKYFIKGVMVGSLKG